MEMQLKEQQKDAEKLSWHLDIDKVVCYNLNQIKDRDVRLRLRGSSNQRIWHILHYDDHNDLWEVTDEKGWKE